MNSDDPYQSKPTPLEWAVILTVVLGGYAAVFWVVNEGRSPQGIWNGLYPYLLSGGVIFAIRFLWRWRKQNSSGGKRWLAVFLLVTIVSYWTAEMIKLVVNKNTDWDAIILTLGAAILIPLGSWFRFSFWRWVFTTDVGKKRRTLNGHK